MAVPDPLPRAYFDAAAHSPVRESAREAYLAALADGWADPRRLHREGRAARQLLDATRASLAADLGVRPQELAMTGSFIEAAGQAVLGTVRGRRRVSARFVHSAIEHSALLAAADWHRDSGGEVLSVGVDSQARALDFAGLLGRDVAAAALQAANAEVGTLQDLDPVAELCRDLDVPLLCDVSATAGQAPLPRADLLIADPTAWGSVPGLGLFTVRTGVRWRRPWPGVADGPADALPGAGPGGATVSIPAALAAAVSLREAISEIATQAPVRRAAIDRLRAELPRLIPDLEVVGHPRERLPHVLTFSVLYADGEALVEDLDRAGFAVGSGSACTATTLVPSHVLAAMGALTHGNVRVALPPTSAPLLDAQITRFLQVLPGVVQRVRDRLGVSDL